MAGVAVLGACGSSGTSGSATPAASAKAAVKTPTSITVAVPSLPVSYASDSSDNGLLADQIVYTNMDATLLRNPYVLNAKSGQYEQDGFTYAPYLASSYSVNSAGTLITLHLRPGVVSQAGHPFTAEDVVYSFQRRYSDPGAALAPVWPLGVPAASNIVAVNSSTVEIKLRSKNYLSNVMSDLTIPYFSTIWDSTLLKAHASSSDPFAIKWSQTHPNTSYGNYDVGTVVPNQSLELMANPHAIFPPKVTKVTILPVPDAGSQASLLRTGHINIATTLQPSDMKSLQSDKGVTVRSYSSPNQIDTLTMVVTDKPFNNVLVRKALMYAVPYQQIIQNVYSGFASISHGFLDPGMPNYISSGFTDYTYNPTEAKALLKQAGYPNGVSFTLALFGSETDTQSVALEMQSYGKAAGFNIKVQPLPDATAYGTLMKHTYPANLRKISYDSVDPGYQLTETAPDTLYNFANYHVASYLQSVNQLLGLTFGSKAYATKVNQIETGLVNDSIPNGYLFRVQPLMAASSSLGRLAFRIDGTIDFSFLT